VIADAGRWRQVAAIFDQAVELPAGERDAFLDRACGDAELRAEVADLLRAEGSAASLLDDSGAEQGALLVAGDLAFGAGGENDAGLAMLGAYQLVRPLGHGGMGTVFLAERADGGFEQQVAIKLLRGDATDPELRERFLRERQILAGLSHPNVASLLDGGVAADGRPYFVLEYVAGEPITDWCRRRSLPLADRLRLFLDVCYAVQAAHGRRIVHRDLKPSNVLVNDEGRVKLLDFGIAKLLDETAVATAGPHTRTGMRLLTPDYAAPEQHRGGAISAATDVYALGVLLAELLTGKRPPGAPSRPSASAGEPPTDLLAATAEAAAELGLTSGELRRRLRGDLGAVVGTALREEAERRYESAAALASDLERALVGLPVVARPESLAYRTVRLLRRRRGAAVAAVLALLLAAALLALFLEAPWRPRKTAPLQRLSLLMPAGAGSVQSGFNWVLGVAVSPDGAAIAFVAPPRQHLWVRRLADATPRMLAGTEGAFAPFWSPDGRSLGFFAHGRLARVALAGGLPVTLAAAPTGRGGSWSRDGTILFAPTNAGGLARVDAGGGPAREVAFANGPQWGQRIERWPSFLPDGRFLFNAVDRTADAGEAVYLGSLDGVPARRLLDDASNALYLPPGELLFVRDGALMVQPFDLDRGVVVGPAGRAIEGRVEYARVRGYAAFSASPAGVLALVPADDNVSELVWFDPGGRQLGRLGDAERLAYPRLSPDGSRVAALRYGADTDRGDLWVYHLARQHWEPVTHRPGFYWAPCWTPDGASLVYSATMRGEPLAIFEQALAGGEPRQLLAAEDGLGADSVSPDGRYVLFERTDPARRGALWALPRAGGPPFRLDEGAGIDEYAAVSPDGRWLAYASEGAGRFEIHVQSFPDGRGGGARVAAVPGIQPRWRRDSRELYFATFDGRLMALGVAPGPPLGLGEPRPLFETPRPFAEFDATPGGERFLVQMRAKAAPPPTLTVLVNWRPPVARGPMP